jgi:hypothetical protein
MDLVVQHPLLVVGMVLLGFVWWTVKGSDDFNDPPPPGVGVSTDLPRHTLHGA